MKIDDLLGYPCFWKPPYVYVRAGPGKIFCGSVPENHQSISQLWPVPRIDSYHSYRRISIHWHLKIPTSQAGAVILRVHQVKERLCHSTPSGGYGIARGASSPVSMAGETVAALGVLETKRCNCGDRWGEMQQSALPHQQVISVIWEFDGNHLLSSWSDSIWISSHVKSKQPGNELLVLRQKWDEVRAAMLTQVLPERYILKFMKQTFPISFQRDQFQLKKKNCNDQSSLSLSHHWIDWTPCPPCQRTLRHTLWNKPETNTESKRMCQHLCSYSILFRKWKQQMYEHSAGVSLHVPFPRGIAEAGWLYVAMQNWSYRKTMHMFVCPVFKIIHMFTLEIGEHIHTHSHRLKRSKSPMSIDLNPNLQMHAKIKWWNEYPQ